MPESWVPAPHMPLINFVSTQSFISVHSNFLLRKKGFTLTTMQDWVTLK